jgi:type I restriction enzyme S subunit
MNSDFLNLKSAEELPEGWRPTTIGGVATLQRGNDLSVSERRTGPFPVVGSNGIAGWHDKFVAKGPGVFVGRSGSAGKVTWVETDYWPLNTALWVKDFHGNDRQFVFYLLSSLNLSHVAAGVSVPTLNRNLVHPLRVVVPGEKEQRAIAGVLRTVQGAKEACEQVLAATRQLKQSLLQHLFTYGPVPLPQAAHVPLKETEIGEVPESWRPTTLGQVADVSYGVQAAVAHLKDSSKGIPILTNVNITKTGDIDLTTLRYYEVPQAKRDRFILKKGDVLFNWRSGSQEHVGKTALFMLDGEYTHSSFILRMRCSDAIRPQFLAKYLHWLRSRRYFARTRQQSSVNSVFNKSLSETIPVLLPPLELQDEIAQQLTVVDEKLAAEESRRSALATLFASLLHHLMTGRVRVKDSHAGSQNVAFREK